MHKHLICLILICLGICYIAQANGINQIKFGLISAPLYELDMRLSNQLGRVNVIAEFSIKPDSLVQADYYSFFLNRDVKVQQIYINNNLTSPTFATNLQVGHFVPTLPAPALLDTSSVYICYSFKQADIASTTGVTSFKIKYWIPLPDWQPSANGSSSIGYFTDEYWFPRNIERDSIISIKLTSSKNYDLELNTPCECSEEKEILTHRGCFQDGPGRSSYIKIIKG